MSVKEYRQKMELFMMRAIIKRQNKPPFLGLLEFSFLRLEIKWNCYPTNI